MRQIVETYVGMWIVMFVLMLGISFTAINMHTIQARRIYNDIKAEVQASNGALTGQDGKYVYNSENHNITLGNCNYAYTYTVSRQNVVNHNDMDRDETYIYNSIYRVNMVYCYNVPLFGLQVYPISGYTT